MMRLAINGFGRIGRGVLRALYESEFRQHFEIVAINEVADLSSIAHLTKYDSVHGRFGGKVSAQSDNGKQSLKVEYASHEDEIQVFQNRDIKEIDWAALNLDLLLECSGSVASDDVKKVLEQAPSLRVLYSRPMLEEEVDTTIVFGVNHHELNKKQGLISAASCTTNAIVPVVEALDNEFGIEYATSTTLHSLMNDQPVLDAYHDTNLRKTRAASHSMIPVNTELAKGVERVLPHLKGRFSAQAVRVPTLNVSAIDLSVTLKKDATVEQVNACLIKASEQFSAKIIDVSFEALASCDFNHRDESAIIDASQTRMSGARLLKVWIWFDNEWAYAHRMLDITRLLNSLKD